MVVKKRGLGRGLDALLSGMNEDTESSVPVVAPDSAAPEIAEPHSEKTHTDGQLSYLGLDQIISGRFQPRRDIEPQALEELAESIRSQGVMQPIVVRLIESGEFEIIAGERRWRASRMAGLQQIPAIIRDVPDEAAIAMALIENIQRENLNPIEEAYALHRLQNEFHLTQQQVAEAVGKSRSTITNLLRLMNLTDEVKRMLEYGDIEMGHARALLALSDELQIQAASEVVAAGLSVRQTEQLVKKLQEGDPLPRPRPEKHEALAALSSKLTQKFSMPVNVTGNPQGKGKISIAFSSPEQLEKLLNLLEQTPN
ncbi:ParB/RepB/Spo0J family partition protein [Nitrincola alkalilacustris]|uniref:ParB/RepB/Spo0J family partition protein n=1 Tax=Nitrincola alkalilacustris TaxID=1571224 RepID=UPI00124EC2AA|nr:ParB/RepB/Spo0J family partition protein [Nitrincola alkalilacustris]